MQSRTRAGDPAYLAACRKALEQAAREAEESGDFDLGNEKTWRWYGLFSGGENESKAVYQSFSDEELLDILRDRTRLLGHAPAQKEVFWVYRNYLRMRFGKWPYALKQAGLTTRAGKGGMSLQQIEERGRRYEQLMEMVRDKARKLGRPPHMSEMEELRKELKNWFTTWAEVLDAAGIDRSWQKEETLYKVKNFNREEKDLLEDLRQTAMRLGRAPLRGEVPEETRRKLARRCGTWRNTLHQIGLEPVAKVEPFANTYLDRETGRRRKHRDVLENSVYKLVNPDEETKRMLSELKAAADRLGRAPVKGEIPARTYTYLTAKCTTYRNALYQIGLSPLERREAARIRVKLRAKKKGGEKEKDDGV